MSAKDATGFTEKANATLMNQLNWEDKTDFENASRGFIASLDDPVIPNAQGQPAWD